MVIAEVLQHTSPELFLSDLKARNKPGVLSELVDKLVAGSPNITKRDAVLQMLESREALGSTAVGPGVAFPHGRTLAVQRLTVLIARSRKGVDFDSVDGEPTHLFFVLIAPPQDSGHKYIKSLAALTEKLQDANLRKTLLAAEDFATFCAALRED
ncbi:MAG TPA: PTS sugar transporter subunit IIA [Candidatus Krumholzibacteria bacterium]|nr:PTS sugar transporter subunit IIA [Candidatus Krumholzibacteria bacterium]HPD72120.1 PTS sugar transporter subunit IIA [Candidatus Krumholzibacteria bacterium]HRY40948.1 PTS sugar transporter subunit IIA [Candidatus Krumholzibacteria bacterium]